MSQRAPRRASPLLLLGFVIVILTGSISSCSSSEDATATRAPTPSATAPPSSARPAEPGPADGSGETSGVSDERVLFGQSAAFSGPAQGLGRDMRHGIAAAFLEVNRAGGVHGRVIELQSLDDAYEPEAAIANTLRLIEDEQVFALIGAVGTPTSRSATPVALSAGVPYVAPFTGAAFLRDAQLLGNVINLRASYNQETEKMVAELTSVGIERIAVMYQDDSFGRAGYQGALLALGRRGMEPVAVGLYPRNTQAVKTALLDLRRGSPQAVIMIGAYEPVGTFIAWARTTGMDAVFMTVSFVGSNALAEQLGPRGEGVVVTQVVPFPSDTSVPVVASYRRALSAYDPVVRPGFVSLEGYLAGRLAIAGLERCGPDLTRTCFREAILGAASIDVDDFELRYGEGDNQGSDEVFLTVIGSDGLYYPIERLAEVRP